MGHKILQVTISCHHEGMSSGTWQHPWQQTGCRTFDARKRLCWKRMASIHVDTQTEAQWSLKGAQHCALVIITIIIIIIIIFVVIVIGIGIGIGIVINHHHQYHHHQDYTNTIL